MTRKYIGTHFDVYIIPIHKTYKCRIEYFSGNEKDQHATFTSYGRTPREAVRSCVAFCRGFVKQANIQEKDRG